MKFILIFLFPFLLSAQRDKALHYYAGLTIGIGVGQIFYNHYENPYKSIPISFGIATGAGWGKELYDKDFGTGFNKQDFQCTAWGAFNSVILNTIIYDIRIKKENKKYKSPL